MLPIRSVTNFSAPSATSALQIVGISSAIASEGAASRVLVLSIRNASTKHIAVRKARFVSKVAAMACAREILQITPTPIARRARFNAVKEPCLLTLWSTNLFKWINMPRI